MQFEEKRPSSDRPVSTMQKQPYKPIRNSPKVMTEKTTQTWVEQYDSDDQQKCIVEDTEIPNLARYAMAKKNE